MGWPTVRAAVASLNWDTLSQLRRARRVQTAGTLGLVVLGPVLAVLTFLVLGPLDQGASSQYLRLVLLADFVYILVVAALLLQRVAAIIAARRAQSAGSRLHLRLTGVFAIMALMPAVLTAVFSFLTINLGLETWFSDRVRSVVGASLTAAQSYEANERAALTEDAGALSNYLSRNRVPLRIFDDGSLRQVLSQGQSLVQRGLSETYVIDGQGEIRVRGARSYLFDFERPSVDEIARAADGETVLIEDFAISELRALVAMQGYLDHYLYITRDVDGEILELLDETQETAQLYQQQEQERGRLIFDFARVYLAFGVILILAAVWLGLWFAERLSGPVGRLAGAAQRVGSG
ncbi:MAG: PAS domain-containing sensor histidine kinase, partial [Pseudomonadota bacterium]